MTRPASAFDWMSRAPGSSKLERIEAFFGGQGYDLHRHDTYAIGRTLAGVQSFHYRRGLRHSLPGGTLVLHPDEVHDGQAGDESGFHYRMVYVEPALLQPILGGKPLPFIRDGLSSDPRLFAASQGLLQSLDCPLDPLEEDDALFDLAMALAAASGTRHGRKALDYPAAERARAHILEGFRHPLSLAELERVSGRDRWSLSRDFRALYGTSPYRYLTLRRLEQARHLLLGGFGLADVAVTVGFSDQSHLTRHFGKTYGLSPAYWLRMQKANR
ncbi:AraC family transcriptional regulator [Pseudomonas sp. RIT-PI-AD]|uniref:AraC family transcriptional regulator n=1 Tax=Pseudomonas sp. RIT-PI-AD TaxID=3035294 RepID=UPI0021D847B0|nr:AraC family transcriptional regulator [Pseudomonas sp. RIT-PI-AD]